MVKAIIFLSSCVLAGSIMAQPNNVGLSSNLYNVFNNSNIDNNINVQQSININVQQAININKPKPKANNLQGTRRANLAANKPRVPATKTQKPKTVNVNSQANVRRPTRNRRVISPSSSASTNTAHLVVLAPIIPVEAPHEENSTNVINVLEFMDQNPEQQMIGNDFIPIQNNEENVKENNKSEGITISLPEFKKPQIYFSYADLSVTHKSYSLKREISKKAIKFSRKHKAKHSGRIKRYITNNCCKWN